MRTSFRTRATTGLLAGVDLVEVRFQLLTRSALQEGAGFAVRSAPAQPSRSPVSSSTATAAKLAIRRARAIDAAHVLPMMPPFTRGNRDDPLETPLVGHPDFRNFGQQEARGEPYGRATHCHNRS